MLIKIAKEYIMYDSICINREGGTERGHGGGCWAAGNSLDLGVASKVCAVCVNSLSHTLRSVHFSMF